MCDERNREYLLLTTEQGGVFLMAVPRRGRRAGDHAAGLERKEAARMERLLLFDEQYERPPIDEHLHMFAY